MRLGRGGSLSVVGSWLVLLAGCSTVTVRVPVMRPAEVNLRGKSELVIGELGGPAAATIAGLLKESIVNSGRFKLVSREHMEPILQELQLGVSDLADPESRRKLGKLMTGSILLTGTVTRSDYDEETTASKDTCTRSEKGQQIEYDCVQRQRLGRAEVAVSFDVVDIETGENLKPKQLSCKRHESTRATDATPAPIDGSALLEVCQREVVGELMKAIAPWQDHVNAPFLRDGDLPGLEVGIHFATQGLWDDAIAKFKESLELASTRADLAVDTIAKAHWDLGLAYEYTFRFDEAIEQVKKAYAMTQNPDFLQEVSAIERLRDEQRRLQEQTGGGGR